MDKTNRTRSHNVCIRMNDAELENLQRMIEESGQTKQSFILNAINGSTIATPETVAELRQLNRNLKEASDLFRGTATNVNQIAHNTNLLMNVLQDDHPDAAKANALIGSLPNQDDIEQLAKNTEDYRKEIDSLWLLLRQLTNTQKLAPGSETSPSTSCETTR